MDDPTLARANYESWCRQVGIDPQEILDPVTKGHHTNPHTTRWRDDQWAAMEEICGKGSPWRNPGAFMRSWCMFGMKVASLGSENKTPDPIIQATIRERRLEAYRSAESIIDSANRDYRQCRNDGQRTELVNDVRAMRDWAAHFNYKDLVETANDFLVTVDVVNRLDEDS